MSDKIVVKLTPEEYSVLMGLINEKRSETAKNRITFQTHKEQEKQLALDRLAQEEIARRDNELKNNNHPYRCKHCNRQAKMYGSICGKCKREKKAKKEDLKNKQFKLSNLWKK